MEYNSLFARAIHPFKQLGLVFAFFLFCVLIIIICQKTGIADPQPQIYWEAAFTTVMIYVLFSSALCFSYPNKGQYFMYALLSFFGLMIITGVIAHFISGQSIDEGGSGSFRWLYMVFTFSYLVLLMIVNSMFKILDFVKKQDARLRGEE
jgi:hypothetical protein